MPSFWVYTIIIVCVLLARYLVNRARYTYIIRYTNVYKVELRE